MKTFLTPEPIVLEIRNAAGEVAINLVDGNTTTVEVVGLQGFGVPLLDDLMSNFRRPSDAQPADVEDAVRIDLRVAEHGTVLIVDTDPARRDWRSGFAVTINAPRGSGVRTQTQSATVRITGQAQRLDVRTASGDVVADQVDRGSLVQTASGDVQINELGSDAEIRTASGDVTVLRSGGALSVHTTSGTVRVQHPTSDVAARSVSGAIRIDDAAAGVLQATAVSGDIEIGVHPGVLARVDLATLSGDTRNDFELRDTPDHQGPESQAQPDTEPDHPSPADPAANTSRPSDPAAALSITCRTTSGDIALRRATVAA